VPYNIQSHLRILFLIIIVLGDLADPCDILMLRQAIPTATGRTK
jgi:hypothetical protein